MGKSPYGENLDLVQTQVTGFLKPLGFRKRARTYNRLVDDGLIHVVNLQAGPYEFGDEIPGLRPNLWGLFTVNLSVYVPELDPAPAKVPRKHVPEYVCPIRTRFARLLDLDADPWWPLDETWPNSSADVLRCLEEVGLPFFDRYRSQGDVLARWIEDAKRLRLSNVARVDVARLLATRGQQREAGELLQAQYDESGHLKGHQEYLGRLADELGIGIKTG